MRLKMLLVLPLFLIAACEKTETPKVEVQPPPKVVEPPIVALMSANNVGLIKSDFKLNKIGMFEGTVENISSGYLDFIVFRIYFLDKDGADVGNCIRTFGPMAPHDKIKVSQGIPGAVSFDIRTLYIQQPKQTK